MQTFKEESIYNFMLGGRAGRQIGRCPKDQQAGTDILCCRLLAVSDYLLVGSFVRVLLRVSNML